MKYRVLWLAEKLSIRCATGVVVVSSSLAEELQRHSLLAAGGAWLIGEGSSNGVDQEAVRAAAAAGTRKPGAPTTIGFIGRITTDKGVDTLCAAMAGLPAASPLRSTRLLVVGPVESEQLERDLSDIDAVDVDIIGATEDPWHYLSEIDILVLPTRREGFPNVVLEAAVMGIPTVTTTVTGARDAVHHNVTGLLITPSSPGELAAAMELLVVDIELRERLGRGAQRWSQEFLPATVWAGLEVLMCPEPEAIGRLRRVP